MIAQTPTTPKMPKAEVRCQPKSQLGASASRTAISSSTAVAPTKVSPFTPPSSSMRDAWPLAVACAAVASLACAGCTKEAARPPVTPAATVVGEPQSCVPLPQLRETQIRDDWTIDFIFASGRVWRNTLTSRCSGLKVSHAFTYEATLNQLCNTDIIYVLEPTLDLRRGAACGLGQFVPVKLDK